jgi:hypothetical protein
MTEKEIEEGNELIDRFIGNESSESMLNSNYKPLERYYHRSYDWLMPVVEKIEHLGFNIKIQSINDEGLYNDCIITNQDDCFCRYFEICDKIEAVYKTIIEFIKWYNNKQKQII